MTTTMGHIGRANIDYNVYNFKQFKKMFAVVIVSLKSLMLLLSFASLSSELLRVSEWRKYL